MNTTLTPAAVIDAMEVAKTNRRRRFIGRICPDPMTELQIEKADHAIVGLAELLGVDPEAWINAAAKLRYEQENPDADVEN